MERARLVAVLLAAASTPVSASAAAKPATPSRASSALAPVAAMIEAGQLGPAEQQLRRLLGRGAGAAARSLLGLVLTKQGRLDEAERELRQAVAADPALLDGRQHLARLHLARQREGDAVAELRRAARLGPLDRDLGLKLASVERSEGHPAIAARLLRSVAGRFESVQALVQLARLESDQKGAAAALEPLGEARAMAPNSEEVLSAYAEALLAARGPMSAIPVLDALERLCPTVAEYRYRQGVALLQVGAGAAAASSLKEAHRLEPDQPLTLIALGTALDDLGLYGEARPLLLRGLTFAPEDVDALAALAEAEEGLGLLDDAETHAWRALDRAGGHALANRVMGAVLMKRERYPEARDALVKAAAGDAASPKAHHLLSEVYARLDDAAGSQKHLELYRQKLKEAEERTAQVGRATRPPAGGRP